jgi:hypothetical protein
LLVPVAVMFFLGVIGSMLHPHQSARELAEGPVTGPAAIAEAAALSDAAKRLLVGRACAYVALLIGGVTALAAIAGLGFRWYSGLGSAWVVMILVGGFLKFAFGTVRAEG